MKHHYTIYSGLLTLRPIIHEDLEQIRVWRNKDDIRNAFVNSQLINKEEQEKWFMQYLSKEEDIMFAAEWENKLIGVAALYAIDEKAGTAEFGRLMVGAKQVRGLGLGKKITSTICSFGFETLHLKKIELEVFINNIPAIKVYEQVGFIKEAVIVAEDKKLYKMSLYR